MAEEGQGKPHEPLFSEGEAIAVAVFLLTLDVADIFSFGIPATDLVSWGIQAYEYKKGTSGALQIIVGLLELIPGADWFPTRSIAFGLIVWGDNHPDSWFAKLIKVAESAKVAGAIKESVAKTVAAKAAAAEATAKAAAAAEAARAAAAEGATAAEKAAARAAAEETAEATKGAGAAKGAAKTARRGAVKTTAKEYARQRMEGGLVGEGEEGGEGEGGEEEDKPLSPEEQELEDIMSGDLVGQHLLRSMTAEEILATIGEQEKSSRFDPNVMGPGMRPKPAKKWAAANDNDAPKGIINNEQVDLKNPKKPEERELLQDAA